MSRPLDEPDDVDWFAPCEGCDTIYDRVAVVQAGGTDPHAACEHAPCAYSCREGCAPCYYCEAVRGVDRSAELAESAERHGATIGPCDRCAEPSIRFDSSPRRPQ